MFEIQQALFDWGELPEDTRAFVLEKTEAIRARMKRTAEDVIAIGQDLMAVKERLPHGQFLGWLQSEFEMGYTAALRFMQVAQRFLDQKHQIGVFPVSVLYELAAPSMPDEIVEQVISHQIPASLPAIREAKAALASPMPPAATYEPPVRPAYEPVTRPYTPSPVTPLHVPQIAPPADDWYASTADIQQMEVETDQEAAREMGYVFRMYMRGKLMDFEKISDQAIRNALRTSDPGDINDFRAICREAKAWLSHVEELIDSDQQITLIKRSK